MRVYTLNTGNLILLVMTTGVNDVSVIIDKCWREK
jgi:hypothetical protein